MAELVSERYAGAIFEASLEGGCIFEVSEQISLLKRLFEDNPDYIKLLASPVIEGDKKHELITELLAEGNGWHPYLKNILFLLADNKRFSEFSSIAVALDSLCDKHENRLRVKAITAIPLTDELSERLQKKLCELTKKNVIIENKVDPSIIGGVTLKYNNTEVDASIRLSLGEMKRQIKESAIQF